VAEDPSEEWIETLKGIYKAAPVSRDGISRGSAGVQQGRVVAGSQT